MNILIIHNAYQLRGGEDAVVNSEACLLREAGHSVHLEIVQNTSIDGIGDKARAFLYAPFNKFQGDRIERLVREKKAEIVHIHNFFPLLTPAIHEAAERGGAVVIQTLHNYRLLCASAMFLRNGSVCEKCLVGSKAWGVLHRCYRGSMLGSLAVARMQLRAESRGVWQKQVKRFIALTDFAKNKFIEGGLPAERIVVKPNFVTGPLSKSVSPRVGGLFVGRLSEEKGVKILLEAWRQLPDLPLIVIGDGPQLEALTAIAPKNVIFAGPMPPNVVREYMAKAAFLVQPSICYEGFPMTVVEAFSAGLPVVASRIGSLAEIVLDGENGRLFQLGNPKDLSHVVRSMLDSDALSTMAKNARDTYENHYTPERNLKMLEDIYSSALLEEG